MPYRSAIVTGAAGGIGRAIAIRLAESNCRGLVIVDLDGQGLGKTKALVLDKAPATKVVLVVKDLQDQDGPESICRQAVDNFGRLDYLVNCAGIPGGFATSPETAVETFDRVHAVNVRASWLLQRAAIKQMMAQELVDDE